MTQIRPEVKNSEWGISKHAFYAAYHYAMQYNEWLDRYNALEDTSQAVRYDKDAVQVSPSADMLSNVAIERAELSHKIDIITETVSEAAPGLEKYILKAVTNENITYDYLSMVMEIPCGKNYYYDRRRKFYYLLSKKICI